MITAHSKKIPNITGLILLDCWEPQVYSHLFKDKFYINLIDNIGDKHFEWIVNSANGLHIDLSDHALATTMKMCNYNDTHPVMVNLLNQSGNEKTSALISRYLLKKTPTVIILNEQDFVWFGTKYLPTDHEQNWLVAGHTWQMCTHEAGLGLHSLSRITKNYPLNFYATDYSFCTMTEQTATLEDFEQDSMNWCLIKGFGYQLLPATEILHKYPAAPPEFLYKYPHA